jgi:hypothetical protein
VCATALTEGQPAAQIVEIGDKVKCPSIKMDRSDLARYVVDKIFDPSEHEGHTVDIIGMKQ